MVGILLITHGDIGRELLRTAKSIIKEFPAPIDSLRVEYTFETQSAQKSALSKIKALDKGDGVLILTDLFGATPHNIAGKIPNHTVSVVSGLNLPMLLKSLNYASLPLNELADKASEGGHVGITCKKEGVL